VLHIARYQILGASGVLERHHGTVCRLLSRVEPVQHCVAGGSHVCELPSCDVCAGSRSWHLHGLAQVNQRLLAHFQDPFLRAVEIRNEPDDRRKGEGDGKPGERAARA
jgi:hypothetical protein